jgi:hypothetical protein
MTSISVTNFIFVFNQSYGSLVAEIEISLATVAKEITVELP